MKKFEKVVNANEGIGNVIDGMINNNMDSDYNDYKVGDEIVYEFWLEDFEENCDYECSLNELKEFVGEGVCLEDKELSEIWGRDIWYNVSIKEENLLVEFLADESMCEKI